MTGLAGQPSAPELVGQHCMLVLWGSLLGLRANPNIVMCCVGLLGCAGTPGSQRGEDEIRQESSRQGKEGQEEVREAAAAARAVCCVCAKLSGVGCLRAAVGCATASAVAAGNTLNSMLICYNDNLFKTHHRRLASC